MIFTERRRADTSCRPGSVSLLAFAVSAALLSCTTPPLPPESALGARRLPLEGTLNTRDLGGYLTEDGRRVRWGQLYRSDQLSDLADEDVDELAAIGLRTVFDLRTDPEREGRADRLPPSTELVHLTMSHPSMDSGDITGKILTGRASHNYFEMMLERANRSFALDHTSEIAALLRALAEPGALPALFHCTYGKDRTGFVSAMVLDILGVPWETIEADYLLSNVFLEEHTRRMSNLIWFASLFRISRASARDLLGVHPDYLESARSAIEEEYGSTEAYFLAIGVDEATQERLRDALLEPVPDAESAGE